MSVPGRREAAREARRGASRRGRRRCSRERAPPKTPRTEGGGAGRPAWVQSNGGNVGKLQPIPDPKCRKRCRGSEVQEGRARSRALRGVRVPGAEPPAALKGRARRESSPCGRGNAVECGAIRRGAEVGATVPVSRCARENRNASERACRVRRTSTDATFHTHDLSHVRATPGGRARHPRGCEVVPESQGSWGRTGAARLRSGSRR